jgi:hypothetical protein
MYIYIYIYININMCVCALYLTTLPFVTYKLQIIIQDSSWFFLIYIKKQKTKVIMQQGPLKCSIFFFFSLILFAFSPQLFCVPKTLTPGLMHIHTHCHLYPVHFDLLDVLGAPLPFPHLRLMEMLFLPLPL